MGNQNEDYLDQLLNSLNSQEVPAEENQLLMSDNGKEPTSKKERKKNKSFLDEFDKEMEDVDFDSVISDFESILEEDLGAGTFFKRHADFSKESVSDEELDDVAETVIIESALPKEDYSVRPTKKVTEEEYDPILDQAASGELNEDFFSGLERAMKGEEAAEDEPEIQPEVETDVENEDPEVTLDADMLSVETDAVSEVVEEMPETDASFEEVEQVSEPVKETSAASVSDDDIFSALLKESNSGDGASSLDSFGFGNLFGEPDTSAASEPASSDDILQLLGEDAGEDLADIGKMLKAQDNNEDIAADDFGMGVSEEEALGMVRDLDAEQPKEAKKKLMKSRPKNTNGGLFAKLAAWMGEDDEEQTIHVHPNQEIEDTTAENAEILKSMAKKEADAEKKARKEEQKKKREAKKEAKRKLKEEQKRQKEAKKKAKEKEKKPKVVDKSPPLPKKPVFLIFLLAASLVGAVLFASNGLHYAICMNQANDAYSRGDYVTAYSYVRNTEIKAQDKEFTETIGILACMQELLESYETLYEAGEYEMALDCLVRVVGRYEDNLEKASELGFVAQLNALEAEAEAILESEYELSYQETLEIYHMRTRMKYSIRLVEVLREVGKIR